MLCHTFMKCANYKLLFDTHVFTVNDNLISLYVFSLSRHFAILYTLVHKNRLVVYVTEMIEDRRTAFITPKTNQPAFTRANLISVCFSDFIKNSYSLEIAFLLYQD